MYKKSLFIFVLILFFSTTLSAQSFFTIKGGVFKFTGENSEHWNTGFTVSGEYAYMFSRLAIIGIGGIYNKMTPNNEKALSDSGLSGTGASFEGYGTITGIYLVARGYLYNEKSLSFYIQSSPGLYNIKKSIELKYMGAVLSSYDDSETKFGSEFSAGLAFGGQKIKFLISPSYFYIKDSSFFTISGGLQFYF